MLYFDTSYLVRLHARDAGWERVRALAATGHINCCLHGRAEVPAAFHRKFREGSIDEKEFRHLMAEFDRDSDAGAFTWLPLSPTVIDRVKQTFLKLPATAHLRAADAVHLGCAAENGFEEIYSNDAKLLASAAHFGLKGMNII